MPIQNIERRRARALVSYYKHREKRLAYGKIWREENKEKRQQAHLKYYQENKEKIKQYWQSYWLKAKLEVLTYYGNGKCRCVKCGESRLACLSIDHINGNGAKHRRTLKRSDFYRLLRNNNFPPGYQTLCMNCQWVKKFENGEFRNGKAVTANA